MGILGHILRASRVLVWTAIFVWAWGKSNCSAGEDKPERPWLGRPNLIVVLVDDLGWQDTSVPFWKEATALNQHFRTPNVQQLAHQGVRFTDAHSCTVCSPTRISLLTGRNAARHGTTNWIFSLDQETSGTTPRLSAPEHWRRMGLDPAIATLPQWLRDRWGYRTIHVGKAHLGAVGTTASDPCAVGFDVNIAGHAAGHPADYHGTEQFGATKKSPHAVPGLAAYHGTDTHLTDALTIEANRAITQAVQEERPFFLHLAHYAVHTPIQSHAPHVNHYLNQVYAGTQVSIPETEAHYASMVEGVDASLGSILRHLDSLKISRQTLIVFVSDNGGLSRHARGTTPMGTGANTHCWPLREGKGSAYEGGTRVPLVFAWASIDATHPFQQRLPIPSNVTCSAPTLIEDLFPTLLAIAAQSDPLELPPEIDGRDLTGLLQSPHEPPPSFDTTPLIFHYPHQWTGPIEGGYQPHSAIRVGAWKAIYFYESKRWELYNLADDVSESHQVAGQHPDLLMSLAKQLQQLLLDRHAHWPVNRWTGQPEPLKLPSEIVFPGREWTIRTPAEAGWEEANLKQVADYLGGRGAITHGGYLIYQWGDATRPADVASAVKPWFTHLLIEAVQSGKLPGFDTQLAEFETSLFGLNPNLYNKDIFITFRHAATQTSCYGVAEKPGEAFNYNDFQMALFCDILITRVLETPMPEVDERLVERLIARPLQCQDRPSLLAMGDSDRAGRLRISPRDFCRFGLLYLREGQWNGQTLVEPEYARLVTHSPHPATFPRTAGLLAAMLPDQRSLGSLHYPDDQTDHLGSYSWAWWVNGQRKSGQRLWPHAPPEVYACLGHKHGQAGMAVIPAWDLVLSWNDTKLRDYAWPDPQQDPHPLDEVFRLLDSAKKP